MSRSLLSQLEQIAGSEIFNDAVGSINTQSVAEPADSTVSGSIEYDLNALRTLTKQIKGTANWYDAPVITLSGVDTALGDRDYTEENFVVDFESVTSSVDSLDMNLQDAFDEITIVSGTIIGDRDYTEENYINDGESITTSLNALDIAIATISGAAVKYAETLSGDINAEASHLLPHSISYTVNDSDTQPGKNLDIFVNGQLLLADYNTLGNNDYEEVDSTHFRPHFKIKSGANIIYNVRL